MTSASEKLNRIEKRVLLTVLHRPREERWNHPTFNKLRNRGFVAGEIVRNADGRASARYRWSITEAGRAAFEASW